MIRRLLSSRPRMIQAPRSLNLSSTLPSSKLLASPALKELGGSDRTLGNKNRNVPRTMPTSVAVRVNQPMPIQVNRKNLRSFPLAGVLGGAGLGGKAGLGGAEGGPAVTAVAAPDSAAGVLGLGSDIASFHSDRCFWKDGGFFSRRARDVNRLSFSTGLLREYSVEVLSIRLFLEIHFWRRQSVSNWLAPNYYYESSGAQV